MKVEKYHLKSDDTLTYFEFIRVGIKGAVRKIIEFQITTTLGLYNLAFGDKDPVTGELDDLAITNEYLAIMKNEIEKKIEELNKSKVTIIAIDPSLNKYQGKVLLAMQPPTKPPQWQNYKSRYSPRLYTKENLRGTIYDLRNS